MPYTVVMEDEIPTVGAEYEPGKEVFMPVRTFLAADFDAEPWTLPFNDLDPMIVALRAARREVAADQATFDAMVAAL